MPAGSFVVIDAMSTLDAGVLGDILCARMKVRGVAAIVTDGVIRDIDGMASVGLPVWCQGTAAPPSVCGLTFVGWQEPVACGGVAVFPDDIIVADRDGAVVIPQALLGAVLEAGAEQERLEAWIMAEVMRGIPLLGLYPPNPEALARYEASKQR
jgi:regulator of RNase E activity RraA